jgi:hypothetical protein
MAGGPPTSARPEHPTGTDPPSGARAFVPSKADQAAMSAAYGNFVNGTACPVQLVPGTLHAAEITATGVKWAFGRMESKPGCSTLSDGLQVDPNTESPFDGADTDAGVFEQQPGGPWAINWFESVPFPCPADPRYDTKSPGPGEPYVPRSVLDAVHVPYAPSGCDHLNTAERLR